jgi:hypothetical protein
MLRRSREGKASSRGLLTTQYLGQLVAYTGPVHMWVALHMIGTIGMGWEDDFSEVSGIKSLCTMDSSSSVRVSPC